MRRTDGVALNIAVLPELRMALKSRAATEGMTMVEKLHLILCESLGWPDLVGQPPESTVRR